MDLFLICSHSGTFTNMVRHQLLLTFFDKYLYVFQSNFLQPHPLSLRFFVVRIQYCCYKSLISIRPWRHFWTNPKVSVLLKCNTLHHDVIYNVPNYKACVPRALNLLFCHFNSPPTTWCEADCGILLAEIYSNRDPMFRKLFRNFQ